MEHALVFVSIIVGVAVTDLIISLHRLLRARRRVRWHVLPLAVATLVMLLLVRIWWAAAQQRVTTISIGAFLPDLIELILLVLLAAAVLPDEVGPDGVDLGRFYDEEGRYFWTLFTLAFGWTLAVQIVTTVHGGVPFARVVGSMLTGDIVFLGLTASLIFVRRRWWHAIVLALLSVGPLQWLGRSLS